jgi:hypothetical protein
MGSSHYQNAVKYLSSRLDTLHHDVYSNISLAVRNYPSADIGNRLGVTIPSHAGPEMLMGVLARQGVTVFKLRETATRLKYNSIIEAIDTSYDISQGDSPAMRMITVGSLAETNMDAFQEMQRQFGKHWRRIEDSLGLTTEVVSGDELLAVLMETDLNVMLASMECVPVLSEAVRAIRNRIDPPKEDSAGDCVVCLCEPATHAMIPCGHRCVCEDCSEGLLRSRGACPICRACVDQIVKIYLS